MRGTLLVLAILIAVGFAAALRAEPAARVTTDSREFCLTLADRLAQLPGGAREPARSLAIEGLMLCDRGHVRTGVAKLRRALRAAQADPARQTPPGTAALNRR